MSHPPATKHNRSFAFAPYLFMAPSVAFLSIFFFIPVVVAFFMSLTDFNLYSLADWRDASFVGFANYAALLRDSLFWRAALNTFYFVIVGCPLTIIVALVVAVILNSKVVRLRSLFRLGYFAPVVTTMVAVAIVWKWLYHPRFGLVNWALGLVGLPAQDWLSSTFWAMPALILMAVWKNFGYNMVIFLAGLQTIPLELYEAAKIDGAGARHLFLKITIPLLGPTTLFVSIITTIGYLQFFAEPYVMTNGGPLDSTVSIVLLMYREAFRFWNMGYASAIAFVLFGIIFVLTMIQLRRGRSK